MVWLADFRAVCLPYCLVKQQDEYYVVLNREYKPLGFYTKEFIKYEQYPISIHISGLTSEVAKKVSWDKSGNLDNIYLYNDEFNPIRNKKNMDAYLKKLEILAHLLVP